MGQGAAGGLRRGALHPVGKFDSLRPVGAAGLHADALAVFWNVSCEVTGKLRPFVLARGAVSSRLDPPRGSHASERTVARTQEPRACCATSPGAWAACSLVMLLVAVLVFVLTRARRATRSRCCSATRPPPKTSRACRRSTASTSRCRCSSAYWLRELAHGNLGHSIFLQRPVTQALRERAEPTSLLALMAVAIAALIGMPVRHRLGGVARPRGRPGLHRLRDAGAPACRASGSAWC